jgi:glucuronokinase
MIIEVHTPARVGLIGNPSDGYGGKTISFTFDAFCASVRLWESPELNIRPWQRDRALFVSLQDLVQNVCTHGYYGGIRLLKAVIKVFYDYCQRLGIELEEKNFTMAYETTIPSRVGLAGSSAIITSAIRALMRFYGITIPKQILPNLVLSVETDELGIGAGLQDRVAQVYGGLVYMDFAEEYMNRGFGHYENLETAALPPLFLAYDDAASEGTEVVHNPIHERYEKGEALVVDTLNEIAMGAERFRQALEEGDVDEMHRLMDANFDLRCKIYEVGALNRRMANVARRVGACAKLSGSGGAVIGVYRDEEMYAALEKAYKKIGVNVLRPRVVTYPYNINGGPVDLLQSWESPL